MKRTIIIAAVLLLVAICLPFLWKKTPDNPPPVSPSPETTVTYSFSTPEEYMAECKKLSAAFWKNLSRETEQEWYDLSKEASERFPDNPKIMGYFATVSIYRHDPADCLNILLPFLTNLKNKPILPKLYVIFFILESLTNIISPINMMNGTRFSKTAEIQLKHLKSWKLTGPEKYRKQMSTSVQTLSGSSSQKLPNVTLTWKMRKEGGRSSRQI